MELAQTRTEIGLLKTPQTVSRETVAYKRPDISNRMINVMEDDTAAANGLAVVANETSAVPPDSLPKVLGTIFAFIFFFVTGCPCEKS